MEQIAIVKEILQLKNIKKEKATKDTLKVKKEMKANRNIIDKSVIEEDMEEESILETLNGLEDMSTFIKENTDENLLKPKSRRYIQDDDKDDKISISGMDLLPDGGILVIDINKRKLFKLNDSYKVMRSYELPGNPCDVRYISDGNTALCIDYNHIVNIDVSKDIANPVTIVKMNGVCAGIACNDNLLYIADSKGSVYTITKGEKRVKNVIHESKQRYKLASEPTCIEVSGDGQLIYLKHHRDLLTLDHGDILISRMTVDPQFRLSGVCVIHEAILVCDMFIMELIQIDRNGKNILKKIHISSEKRCSPPSMCFDNRKSLLLIAERSGRINKFKFSM